MTFCLEAEQFVDDKLSNWYVRRNRRRFWKSEQGADKLAAYQTLYTVLTTLTKLFAPVMPFLTETMYQNLKTAGRAGERPPVRFPEGRRGADRRASCPPTWTPCCGLVSLGSAARNTVKIKVRQPLAEIEGAAGDAATAGPSGRFADQIREELNVKQGDAARPGEWAAAAQTVAKPNMKTLGPKFKDRLTEVKAAIEAAVRPDELGAAWTVPSRGCSTPNGPIAVEKDDLWVDARRRTAGPAWPRGRRKLWWTCTSPRSWLWPAWPARSCATSRNCARPPT